MGLENVSDKNPVITSRQETAAHAKEGVDQTFFDGDHAPEPPRGRYQELDGDYRITIQTGKDTFLTLSAQQFVSDNIFSDFGDSQQRLNLLQKAAKFEVARDLANNRSL